MRSDRLAVSWGVALALLVPQGALAAVPPPVAVTRDVDTGKALLRQSGAGRSGAARHQQLDQLFDREHAFRGSLARRTHLTGGWAGARAWLEAAGIDVAPALVWEGAAHRAGREGRALGELTLTVDGGAFGAPGLQLVAIGQGIGQHRPQPLGDLQELSNIAARSRLQASELWGRYERGPLSIKLGRFDANVDFAALELAVELLHSSFGMPPTVPLPSYPDPGWGALVAVRPAQTLLIEVGWLEAGSDGQRWRWSRQGLLREAVLLTEATLYTGPLFGRGHGGSVHLGGWTDRADRGGWVMAEEPLWASGARLVALFGQLSASSRWPRRAWAVGAVQQGLVPARPNDVVSVALTAARYPAGEERAVEVLWKLALLRSVYLALDAQRIDGIAGVRGAGSWVGIARLGVQL